MRLLKRLLDWIEDRTGLVHWVRDQAQHLVPPKTGWGYVFGSATLIAFIIQVVTGIALSATYVPASGQAFESLRFITHGAPLGRIIRGMHFFGASAMILLIGIHMIRVFLMGAYKFPREMSWITGVVLLGATLALGFTGQLLRWDQNAIWSVVVGAEQAGRAPFIGSKLAHFIMAGRHVGTATLSRFFAMHVFLLPAVIFSVVALHLYLVLRNGISEPPSPDRPVDRRTYRAWYERLLKREGVPFWPEAAWRDVIFGLAVVLAIVGLAAAFGPPKLDQPPNPALINAHPRPDWYLLWYFAVLALLPHGLENVIIIAAPLVVILALFALPILFGGGHRHVRQRPWAAGAVLLVVMSIGSLWIAGVRANWSPDFSAKPLDERIIGVSSGPVHAGGKVFNERGCLYCHEISGHGGHRGPDLTRVGERLTGAQMTIRITNGGYNMPAYGGILSSTELKDLVAFLETRRRH